MKTICKYAVTLESAVSGFIFCPNGTNLLTNQAVYESGALFLFGITDTDETNIIKVPVAVVPTGGDVTDLLSSYMYLASIHQPNGTRHIFVRIPQPLTAGYQMVDTEMYC